MLTKIFILPKDIWITSELFGETIIEKATIVEATYDDLGYKTIYYKSRDGLLAWDRRYPYDVDLFETKQQAIDSVANGNYSIESE